MTPTIGKYYRFEMTCSTVGQVNMSLSDGSTTFTATGITVPQYSFNVEVRLDIWNNYYRRIHTQAGTDGGVFAPFGTGSALAFSNFTSSAAVYNGPQTVFDSGGTYFRFLTIHVDRIVDNQSGTVAGYPSHLIQASVRKYHERDRPQLSAPSISTFLVSRGIPPWATAEHRTPSSVRPRFW